MKGFGQRPAEVEPELVPSAREDYLPGLLHAREAAKILGISARSIFRLAGLAPGDRDRLPAVRIGARVLFRPADIHAYIEAHRD